MKIINIILKFEIYARMKKIGIKNKSK